MRKNVRHHRSHRRLPDWLKVPLPGLHKYASVRAVLDKAGLQTVCQAARCPNIGECFGHGTATFLIMGPICTRFCGFCNISGGEPHSLKDDEPHRVAQAVEILNLEHAVITSVSRDDLSDGGARYFSETIRHINTLCPSVSVEVLIPDFQGSIEALKTVLSAKPDILNHNIETVPRLYPTVRPQASYERSLRLLEEASQLASSIPVKSGFMVGLGEKRREISKLLKDLRSHYCSIVTIGQYLSPSTKHLPVEKYYHPDEFQDIRSEAEALGFFEIHAAPLVRSSYHAHDVTIASL